MIPALRARTSLRTRENCDRASVGERTFSWNVITAILKSPSLELSVPRVPAKDARHPCLPLSIIVQYRVHVNGVNSGSNQVHYLVRGGTPLEPSASGSSSYPRARGAACRLGSGGCGRGGPVRRGNRGRVDFAGSGNQGGVGMGRRATLMGVFLVGVLALGVSIGPAPGAEKLRVGFVYVGPVGDAGWTYAHDQGRRYLQAHDRGLPPHAGEAGGVANHA